MFRHQGKVRTFKHNRKLAAALTFIAGMVNITGVLSLHTLTTNVTGHFAFFAEDVEKKQYGLALITLLYILAFLAGSFSSSFSTHFSLRRGYKNPHVVPMAVEIVLLLLAGLFGNFIPGSGGSGIALAALLLFSMGLQNALVTHVSKSVVRTTHLTGLFTDLGIELAQLCFRIAPEQRTKLVKSVRLRLVIITFFFLGCVLGGYIHRLLSMGTLVVAALLLLIALLYDSAKYNYYRLARKKHQV
ncbi:YoaK family protein [Pontibacter liquoris]|uniref:YoaK family protein n=1 Tax=Pontibacter liquoris TaxID=2905677 RepID=UPI001FA803A3|nr:YoaK family protein [Pontibacter liquoris]